jgi:hypothetical protein
MSVQTNAPQLTANGLTWSFVNSETVLASTLLHKPVLDPESVKRFGVQSLQGLMRIAAKGKAMNPVSNIIYRHWEEDFLHSLVKVEVAVAGAANAAVSRTIQAGWQYTFPSSAQSPYISTSTSTVNPMQVNQIIVFPDGTEAIVTAVTPTTFTCQPIVLGQNIPATTTADEIIITGNSWGEGTDQPGTRTTRLILYENNLQIMKASATVTGTEGATETTLFFPGMPGVAGGNGYSNKLWIDSYLIYNNEVEMQLLIGQKTTNTVFANASTDNATNIKTEGLIPWATNYGNVSTYNATLGVTYQDMEDLCITQLDTYRGADEYTVWQGNLLNAGYQSFIRDDFRNGAIVYNTFGDSGKERAVNYGFSSVAMLGRTFHFKKYDVFSYPTLLGAAGQPYQGMGIFIPGNDFVKSYDSATGGTTTSVPSLRCNYAKFGGFDRLGEEWWTGTGMGTYTNQTDALTLNRRAHRGFEGFAANRFVIQKAA